MSWSKDNGKLAKEAAVEALAQAIRAEQASDYIDGKQPLIDEFTGEQTNLQIQLEGIETRVMQLENPNGGIVLLDGTITPNKTTFMDVSENLINPAKRKDGYNLGFVWNVDTPESYIETNGLTTYTETFAATNGEIIYSNSPGRLIWYGASKLVAGNVAFVFNNELSLYTATVGSGAVTAKLTGYLSDIGLDGYWFVCKSTEYSGNKSVYGFATLSESIGSKVFVKKTEVDALESRVTQLEEPGEDSLSDGSVTPIKTTFFDISDNLINPAKIVSGFVLGFQWNADTVDSKVVSGAGTVYDEVIPTTSGDVIYSNSPGRLIWYNAANLVSGNAAFTFDAATGLYKATVGGGVKSKIDGVTSNINVEGYWYAVKGTYSGTKTPYGAALLKDDIGSKVFASKDELSEIAERTENLENVTATSTFFLPKDLYCYTSNMGNKWIPKYNVLASRNEEQFYLDNTAPNGALRSRDKLKIQANDQVKVKKSTQLQSIADYVFTKTYATKSVNPTTKTNPTTAKNVLMIGDSLTDAGYIPCDVKRQITIQHGFSNFNFVGTKSDTVDGITALSEGNGGYALADYIKTNNAQGRGATFPNPFLNNGVVSFTNYMTRNNFSGNLDYVVIELGVNDMIMLGGTPTTNVASLKTLVDKILSEYPNCKIFVCGLLMIAAENDVYDHVTHNTKALNINKAYEDFCNTAAYLNKCIYVDVAVFFDTEFGYPIDTTPYRGGTTPRKVVTDWLHPNTPGYYMMADTIASAFIYHM